MRCDLIEDRPVASVACAGSATGGGLKEIVVVPWGTVESKNGSFILDEEGADAIVAAFEEHGTALPIDWEHQTLQGEYAAPNGRAPAGGWVEKLWSAPGIGVKALVRWASEAREAIRADTYRYLSPVVLIRKDDKRAVELHSVALTNKPAIPGMARLAASERSPQERETMIMAEEPQGANIDTLLGEVASLLGIKATGDVLATLAAVRDEVANLVQGEKDEDAGIASSVREILGLPGNAGKSEVVLAMKTGGGSASAELAAMRGADVERGARERLQPHLDSGKLNPNDLVAMSAALDLAKTNPAALDRLMSQVVSAIPPGRTTPPTRRDVVIGKAAREYKGDAAMQRSCGMDAAINLALRDAGFEAMSEDETRDYVAL